jgi:hypothetical protein
MIAVRPAYQFQPQERGAAKEAGHTIYFTGRPCKYGHIAMRGTASGTCLECAKRLQKNNAIKKYAKDPLVYKKRYIQNAKILVAKAAEYRAENVEKVKASYKMWIQNNKHKKAANEMRRQSLKIKATPKWLSVDDLKWIDSYYKDASHFKKMFNVDIEVDHIVPLRGKDVCGLHVPWNLCLRTKRDNARKSNKITEEAYLPKQTGVLVAQSALPWNLRKETQNGNCL